MHTNIDNTIDIGIIPDAGTGSRIRSGADPDIGADTGDDVDVEGGVCNPSVLLGLAPLLLSVSMLVLVLALALLLALSVVLLGASTLAYHI
jgi:hypothetical protein